MNISGARSIAFLTTVPGLPTPRIIFEKKEGEDNNADEQKDEEDGEEDKDQEEDNKEGKKEDDKSEDEEQQQTKQNQYSGTPPNSHLGTKDTPLLRTV